MNFDQVKAGDKIYQAFITVEGGYVFEKQVKSMSNYSYTRFWLEDGGDITVPVNHKSSEYDITASCHVFTDERQAVKWVDTQLKKAVRDAEKYVKTKQQERKQFQRKFKKYFTDENI